MSDFKKEHSKVRRMVEKANEHRDARTPTSHDRFHFFSEANHKGLFSFGIYDYVTKKYEMTDVFDTDVDMRVTRMKSILEDYQNKQENG